MNPHSLNFSNQNQAEAAFYQEKQKWENAISNYTGSDPLDLWYNFICWYEQNIALDKERLFETALGKCLSIYECQQHYNQDTRMVKLWMKYIGLKGNPLNLYQVLYQRGIGTQCAIFYVGWAHYYDSANAFKQAESVYNLGFQANAQPYHVLEDAHKSFRFSLSQRMLYSDQQSKKRTVSQLNDQRQQITTLNPSSSPSTTNNVPPNASMHPRMAGQQQPQHPQQQQNSFVQQPPVQTPPPQQQYQNSVRHSQPQSQQQVPFQEYRTDGDVQQPPHKRFRNADAPDQRGYNQSYTSAPNHSNSTPVQEPYHAKSTDYNNQYESPKDHSEESAACAIASSLQSVYSGDEDQGSEDYGYNYNGESQRNDSAFTNETLTYSQANDSNRTMTRTNSIGDSFDSVPSGGGVPTNMARYAKNHFEPCDYPLFIDEPDTNKICKYPRHLVYPGNGSEYSLEEIRARNYAKIIETIKEKNRQREYMLSEQRRMKQFQEQQRKEHEHQIKLQQQQLQAQREQQLQTQREKERLAEIERERIMKERERARQAALEMQRAKEREEAERLAAQQQQQQKMQQQQQKYHQAQQQQQPQYQHTPPPMPNQHNQSQAMHPHQPYYGQEQPVYGYNNYPPPNHQNNSQMGYQQPPVPPLQQPVQQYYNQNRSVPQQAQVSPMHHSPHPQPSHPLHQAPIDQNEMYKSPPYVNNYANSVQHHSPQHVPQHPQHAQVYNQSPMPVQYQQPPAGYSSYHHQEQHHQQYQQSQQQIPQPQHYNNEYQQQQQHPNQQQQQQPPPQAESPLPQRNEVTVTQSKGISSEKPEPNSYVNNYIDDIEEQIEASTIVLENGSAKPQKITIKFRKEKAGNDTQSIDSVASPATTQKTPKTKRSKKSKTKSNINNGNTTNDDSTHYNGEHYELDETYHEDTMSTDSDTMPLASLKAKTPTTKKAKSKSKFEPAYLQDDESYSNSGFNALYGKYSNEATNEVATNGAETPRVRFNFAGATSTPIRNNNNNYQSPCSSAKPSYKSNDSSSKSSTPRNTYKSLRKRASNASLLNHTLNDNDDSMTSFSMVEPNSFFETENNDELRQQRLDKALKTIDEHFKKDFIDPFNSELCKAFLTKTDFPSREHAEFYKLTNMLIPKLANTRHVTIGDIRFNIEKEVGRGAYGNVYRGTNSNTGDIVALKFQKPPNTWELYICTEVAQRIDDPELLLGFMDISAATIAPNASIFVSEFSQFGSLLDINNRIRQSTTKPMHESLVMHFTSQILNIVHHLHASQIIHGDIKPDNFLLMKVPTPNSHLPTLRLIDFGCAIDMKFFKPHTQFKKMIQTDGFTCPEMLEGRPWSYQTDIFCIAGTVHVMLFGEYMQVVKKFGQYEIKTKLPRYLKKNVWTEFFSKFLNIKDVHNLPDLLDIKEKIDNELYGMESELQSQIRTLSNILYKR